ncbi:MAG: hypothetical protein KH373_03650 [Ruminococcus sp.]|nr:hypothetical protein [Ruminococcus sp.]
MKLVVNQKGNKMFAIKKDDSSNIIFTMAKKGFLSNTHIELYNKMGYLLYSLKPDLKGRRANFDVFINDKIIMKASCIATFLNPAIAIKYLDVTYILRSTDKMKFILIKNKDEIGKITVLETLKGDLQFDMDIMDQHFEDFMLLFNEMIYMSFYGKK